MSAVDAMATLSKAELHVHLEGSIRAETLVEMAQRHGMDLPSSLAAGKWPFRDLGDLPRPVHRRLHGVSIGDSKR